MTVLGSKSIGLAIAREVRRSQPGAAILTFDDSNDARSRLTDLVDLGATVLLDPRRPDLRDSELVVVAGWYWLLGDALLNGRRVVGFHNSALPKYRGGSPLVWAMINGDNSVGVSLFELAAAMDAGPIWGQAMIDLGPDDSIGDVMQRLEDASVGLLRDRLQDLGNLAARGIPQNERDATYCAQRKPADGLIQWSWPAKRIHDFVRAQSRPYPGAFTVYEGNAIIVWRTSLTDQTYYGSPGQITPAGVICGDSRPLVITDSSIALPRNGRLSATGSFEVAT